MDLFQKEANPQASSDWYPLMDDLCAVWGDHWGAYEYMLVFSFGFAYGFNTKWTRLGPTCVMGCTGDD